MRLFWAKTGKTSAYFLRFDIKLKKSHPVFDLVTVLISKQSFFQQHVWPVYQGKSYLHGIALPDFNIVSAFFYKRSKQARVPSFVWLFRDVATTVKGPGCDKETNLRWRDFAVVPLMPTRAKESNQKNKSIKIVHFCKLPIAILVWVPAFWLIEAILAHCKKNHPDFVACQQHMCRQSCECAQTDQHLWCSISGKSIY